MELAWDIINVNTVATDLPPPKQHAVVGVTNQIQHNT